MTRLLAVAAVAAAAVTFAAAPASHAYDRCGGSLTSEVCDAICYGCESHVDPCYVVQCAPPYVGCIPGYFCV
jgi:hypothetical protein